MELNEIFKHIQKAVAGTPLILIGSGSSATYGLPTMGTLGKHLLAKLTPLHSRDTNWQSFQRNIRAGMGLEEALTDVVLSSDIIDDIRKGSISIVLCYAVSVCY